MANVKSNPAGKIADKLRRDLQTVLDEVRQLGPDSKSRSLLTAELERSAAALNGLIAELDPINRPATVFDPGNPRTIGFFVALALTAQEKRPLAELTEFYGAGIYALYYKGDFDCYRPISGTETPIYVGMAIQGAYGEANTVRQGTPLAKRLAEHRKNIARASGSLELADFTYRALVVQSGWEATAEDYLIQMFRPLWNRETRILYGFGKHGDSSETRKNKRSPWDTLHAGRAWAAGEHQTDAMTRTEITDRVAVHLEKTRIFRTFEEILTAFIANLKQAAPSKD